MNHNGTVSTPVVQNSWIAAKEVRTFREGSTLHQFLTQEQGFLFSPSIKTYNIDTIFYALKTIIDTRKLFDSTNPHIILCDPQLEAILDVKSFHTSQLKVYIELHLTSHVGLGLVRGLGRLDEQTKALIGWRHLEHLPQKPALLPVLDFDTRGTYRVKPKLLKVLKTVQGDDAIKEKENRFPYRRVCHLLSQYIINNKESLIDLRNIQIIQAKGDLLGKAFGVDHFARPQVTNLIRNNLIKVKPIREK